MKFRKKPVVIEAIQWNPEGRVWHELRDRGEEHPSVRATSYDEVARALGTSGCSKEKPWWCWSAMGVIETLEGPLFVIPGDWIIVGVKGECYPCKPDIFEATYEAVTE